MRELELGFYSVFRIEKYGEFSFPEACDRRRIDEDARPYG